MVAMVRIPPHLEQGDKYLLEILVFSKKEQKLFIIGFVVVASKHRDLRRSIEGGVLMFSSIVHYM